MSKLTITEKRLVNKFIQQQYSDRNPRNIRFHADDRVTVTVDRMPNTNQPGRIFAGWGAELFVQATIVLNYKH